MTFYAQINSQDVLVGVSPSELIKDDTGSTDVSNYEVAVEEYQKYKEAPYKYNNVEEKEIEIETEVIDYDEENNPIDSHTEIITKTVYVLVENPEYEEIKRQKEAERIANLKCTKRVFVLMLEKLGFDYFEQIKPLIESNRQAQLEWDLCVELERKNPLLDVMAKKLGFSSKDIDNIFINANM